MRLQGYKARLHCAVMSLAPGFDLVLGDPWCMSTAGARGPGAPQPHHTVDSCGGEAGSLY
jgi:hypothetical protein